MELFLSLFYTALFIFLIHKMKFFEVVGLSRKTISIFFLIKILFGFGVWCVYTFYYIDRSANDVFKFFDDAAIMFSAIYHHPMHYVQMVLGINTDASYLVPYYKQMANWYKPWAAATFHNNRIIIQFNALVHLFSFGYYHVHTVFMCFLSLLGLTGIYKTFAPSLQNKIKELAFAVFLIPSVLFWGSGVLKEGIILFALGFFIFYAYQHLFLKRSVIGFIWVIFCAIILALTKIYVFAAIVPCFLALILIKKTGNKYVLVKFLGVHVLLLIIIMNVYRVNNEWDVLKSLKHKQWAFTEIAKRGNAGSLISTKQLEPTTISLIENTPEAIINTLFRPHLFEARSVFMLMSALENLLLLILILTSLVFFKKPEQKDLPLLYMSVFFVFSLALLIGLVNPVLGSIVRFRIPLLPFFAIIFILLLDKEKMIERIPFLKRVLKS